MNSLLVELKLTVITGYPLVNSQDLNALAKSKPKFAGKTLLIADINSSDVTELY